MYVVVAVLSIAGDHEPVMPLRDVVGNGVNTAPEQIAATGLNVGVMFGLTVTLSVAVVAHWPAVGVKVYVVVAVLLNAGAQVPDITSMDVVGSVGAAAPLQIAAIGLNVGVVLELTFTVNVDVVAH